MASRPGDRNFFSRAIRLSPYAKTGPVGMILAWDTEVFTPAVKQRSAELRSPYTAAQSAAEARHS